MENPEEAAASLARLHAPHPPAGATTLILSLGILTRPIQLVIRRGTVVLLILQALIINRLAGIPYPLWQAAQSDDTAKGERR